MKSLSPPSNWKPNNDSAESITADVWPGPSGFPVNYISIFLMIGDSVHYRQECPDTSAIEIKNGESLRV